MHLKFSTNLNLKFSRESLFMNESTIFMKKKLMKYVFIVVCLAFMSPVLSQCDDGRYLDLIFPEVDVESDILYGNNLNYLNASTDLFLDVYTPAGDAEDMRPLVVFAHGGSFVAGSKTGDDVVPLCTDFARMGYTTASIQYRLGIPLTTDLELPATEAVVRGYHDMKAAIRFMRKSVAEDGNPYGINPDEIYIAGVSAGGFITLHLAYMDEIEELPTILDLSVDGLTGGLEGDSGNEGYSSEVNGVINICGALGDTTWVNSGDEPLLSFHGPFDTTVPYGSETLTLLGFPVLEVDGSASVSERADDIGLLNCFEIYDDQGHVPHVNSVQFYDTTRAIMRNFLAHLVCSEIDLDCTYSPIIDLSIGEKLENEKEVLIYPNPANNKLFLKSDATNGSVDCVITDSFGREVLRKENFQLDNSLPLDLSGLKSGYYICTIENGESVITKKLLITK